MFVCVCVCFSQSQERSTIAWWARCATGHKDLWQDAVYHKEKLNKNFLPFTRISPWQSVKISVSKFISSQSPLARIYGKLIARFSGTIKHSDWPRRWHENCKGCQSHSKGITGISGGESNSGGILVLRWFKTLVISESDILGRIKALFKACSFNLNWMKQR